ncbi:BQ2448_7767 [Microbotryum intermedium]|uniref:BQ2448_7767 protein n=1 Tax=Microbotryum intermedium TaxID=269621 RepID=A0A238FU36_9BASI|nr:BQ2448_7767 [Microbotryum intermedium]
MAGSASGLGSRMDKPRLVGARLLLVTSVFASLGVFLFGFDQADLPSSPLAVPRRGPCNVIAPYPSCHVGGPTETALALEDGRTIMLTQCHCVVHRWFNAGIITGPYFKAYFHQPNRYELATMVAILEIGALITSLLAGRVGDIFGRRLTLLTGALIFTTGGAFQSFATGFKVMVFGRILSGFGVGFLSLIFHSEHSMIVPVYQSEISPAENRGKLACIEFTLNIAGYASSVWIDYFASFLSSNLSWRCPLFVQCIIGSFLAIGSVYIPESPRWLLDMDMDEEGMKVLADLHGDGDPDDERAKDEFREIKESVLTERTIGDRSYISMWKRYKSRVLIAMSAQMFAQLNGINVISYYAPLVFESAGWIGRDAILMTGINGIIYILSTVPTWYLVDIWGRRPILLSGALIMATSLSSVGYFLYLDKTYTPTAVVISVIVFNAAFGYSWGPIPWLLGPEVFPTVFRVKGVSISTATNWFFNFVVGESTPILQEAIRWRLYLIHAGWCLISLICVFLFYPETMGVPLEEMDALFGDSSKADLESASLVRSHRRGTSSPNSARSGSVEPPILRKHHGEAEPPSASLFDGIKKAWKRGREMESASGSGSAAPANYQAVQNHGQ